MAPPRLYLRPEWSVDDETALALIRREVFGVFVSAGPDGLAVTHLPFVLERAAEGGVTLVSHIALANDHAALVRQGAPSVAVFRAEHGYISSSWYPARPARDSAPTYSYAVVHCHGRPVALSRAGLARHIAALVEMMEQGRPERWRLQELGPGGMERRLPRILGFALPVERLEAKFKLGQDERPADTQAAIARLKAGIDPALGAAMEAANAALCPHHEKQGETHGE